MLWFGLAVVVVPTSPMRYDDRQQRGGENAVVIVAGTTRRNNTNNNGTSMDADGAWHDVGAGVMMLSRL